MTASHVPVVPYGDDPMQAGDLYLPGGAITAATPKLLLIHGGGWRSDQYLRDTLSDEAALFRDEGWAVYNIDYRLAPAAPWPACGDDCLAAARKLVSCDGLPGLEAAAGGPIAILGSSAGGHLALMTGLRLPRKEVIGIVAVSGIGDPAPDAAANPARYEALFAGGPIDPQAFPAALLSPDAPPVLLTHCQHDTVVPIESSAALAREMAARGLRIETYYYDLGRVNLGHANWDVNNKERHLFFPDVQERCRAFLSDARNRWPVGGLSVVRGAQRSLSLVPDAEPVCPLRLKGAPPLFAKLWRCALWEIERNDCVETPYGTIYAAGGEGRYFLARVFNRDVGYSGVLGLNALYPGRVLASMKIIRRIRFDMGWKCPKDRVISGVPGATVEDLTHREFIQKHLKAAPVNKTDDVLWLWCVGDLLERLGNPRAEWEWLYENGQRSFRELYDPFFDAADGLYYGQPTFIDVGGTGYPAEFGPAGEPSTCNRCVWVKAASTNALYFKGLRVIAQAARLLEGEGAAAAWEARAEKLRRAILGKLRFADGAFAYFMHPDGRLEPRREALGTAFPVLLNVVEGEDARRAVAGYPFTPLGAPLLYPFYERDDFYHNNSAWPFASTFLSWAVEKATGESHAAENLTMLASAVRYGRLHEVFDLRNGMPVGCAAQLWTDASVVNACARMGWADLPGLKGPVAPAGPSGAAEP